MYRMILLTAIIQPIPLVELYIREGVREGIDWLSQRVQQATNRSTKHHT